MNNNETHNTDQSQLNNENDCANFSYHFPKSNLNESDKKRTDDTEYVTDSLDNNIRSRAQTEYESDKGYRELSEKIINVSQEHLSEQRNSKKPLREKFVNFFTLLLAIQYVAIVVFIVLNSCCNVNFIIEEEILRLYIISVFLETLSAMAVMITFAFVSTEETKIVGLLNTIITNYQKFTLEKLEEHKSKANDTRKNEMK